MALADEFRRVLDAAVPQMAADIRAKLKSSHASGQEYVLREPIARTIESLSGAIAATVSAVPEAKAFEGAARPDYAIEVGGVLVGLVELKAVGTSLVPSTWPSGSHNRKQWEVLHRYPNLIYTNGNEWRLYQGGDPSPVRIASLSGDVASGGDRVRAGDELPRLLQSFLSWAPAPPRTAEELARVAANLTRVLRDDVLEVLILEELRGSKGPFSQLADDCRDSLFPHATTEQIADWYAQSVCFSLLLARADGENFDGQSISAIADKLAKRHRLLGGTLRILAEPTALAEVATSVRAMVGVIAAVDWTRMSKAELTLFPALTSHIAALDSPWLNFYELFLKQYDPQLRDRAGAYYTPPEVVNGMTRLVEDALKLHIGIREGFADPTVTVLDPAMGSGSFLVATTDRAAERHARAGQAAVASAVTDLAGRLHGFEIMAGPYSVAEMLLSGAMKHYGAALSPGQPALFLTNTLADPDEEAHALGSLYRSITEASRAANHVKREVPIVVVLGNPPYDQSGSGRAVGEWVKNGRPGEPALHDDWVPKKGDVDDGDLRRLGLMDDLYVYFWRWAAWKVFEQNPDSPGIVCFISNSSFIAGGVFARMRQALRSQCDHIYVVDLGGQSRYGRQEQNVFPIRIPVVITVAVRNGSSRRSTKATVHYYKVKGSQSEKLAAAASLTTLRRTPFVNVEGDWGSPFSPSASGSWAAFPILTDLFPFQPQAIDTKRDWIIAPSKEILEARWRELQDTPAHGRGAVMAEGQGRTPGYRSTPLRGLRNQPRTMIGERVLGDHGPIVQVGWRTLDRQWMLGDDRLISRPSPTLWASHGQPQIYLTTMHQQALGEGPAITATPHLPISGHYNGNGAGDIMPLWLDPQGRRANLAPGLLKVLSRELGVNLTPEDFAAYVAGVIAHSGFTTRFHDDLTERRLRIPITRDPQLFQEAVELGRTTLWAQTLGTQFVDPGNDRPNGIPPGRASIPKRLDEELFYEAAWQPDEGGSILLGSKRVLHVSREVWDYTVAPWKVLPRWFSYRQGKAAPRRAKADPQRERLVSIGPTKWSVAWTDELLRIIWAIEQLISLEPRQADALEAIVQNGTFVTVDDLHSEKVLPVSPLATRHPEGRVISSERRSRL